MRLLLIFLSACVAVALLRMAIISLALLLATLTLWVALRHPRQAMGIIAYCTFFGLLQTHPWSVVALIGLGVLVSNVRGPP